MMKVKENPTFSRTEGGSIVNTDDNSYEAFVQKRKAEQDLVDRVNSLESKLDTILEILGKLK
jgi:hypothetical protein